MSRFVFLFLLLATGASALLPKNFFDRRTECDLIRFKSCYKTFILRSIDDAKNGAEEKSIAAGTQCRWQKELDECLGAQQTSLCLKPETLEKVFKFSREDAADHISEYGILKFKCGEGRDLWIRHSECLNFRNNTATFMEEIAKCASRKNFIIFFQSLLRSEIKPELSLPCRFLRSIISCVEEVAVAKCGAAKPMVCKFLQLAPFQQYLVGDRKGIAEDLKNCPREVTHCTD